MKIEIDLHCHTTASDGILTPAGLVDKAIEDGLSMIAVADHDTVDGVDAAITAAGNRLKVISSIEFSVACDCGDFHLLGYFVDYNNKTLLGEIEIIKKTRDNRIPAIVENLRKAGVEITEEEIHAEAGGGSVGKPHVARVIVKKGYVKSFEEAFELHLATGRPGDVPKKKISQQRAFELIRLSGGMPVCAHPKSLELSYSEIKSFLESLIPLGLAGVECYSNMHSDNDVAEYIKIAESLAMVKTGGSDFHGDKGEVLGTYGNGRIIPASCRAEIESWRS